MRLINIWTLELEEFSEKSCPEYFILSHRWGEKEISYKDYSKKRKLEGPGYEKIVGACKFARTFGFINASVRVCCSDPQATKYESAGDYLRTADLRDLYAEFQNSRVYNEDLNNFNGEKLGTIDYGEPNSTNDEDIIDLVAGSAINWIWIDTCCIDKRSTAELSEAINSMFMWYMSARLCFAYLIDVPAYDSENAYQKIAFRNSSWFSRGWTLQELLAPEEVIFCDSGWEVIGHICPDYYYDEDADPITRFIGPNLVQDVSAITGIPQAAVSELYFTKKFSVAQIMSWASCRKTTRLEDEAYCLLGLLGVNMPLIYGEATGAFRRLQEEIIRTSQDQSIFAWNIGDDSGLGAYYGMLADSPSRFHSCGNIIFDPKLGMVDTPYTVTNSGIQLETSLFKADAALLGRRMIYPKSKTSSPDRSLVHILTLNCRRLESDTPLPVNITPATYYTLPCVKLALVRTRNEGCVLYMRAFPWNFEQSLTELSMSPMRRKRIYLVAWMDQARRLEPDTGDLHTESQDTVEDV